MKAFLRLAVLLLGLAVVGTASAAPAPAVNPENEIYLDLIYGRVVIQMRPDLAPKTCAQIKALVRKGFYNGSPFFRVIDGFMAQTGDPTGTGTGGSGHTLDAEFTKTPFVRGTVGMARTSDPDSADSQFFITFAPAPQLDDKYTVWGQVISGMGFVDRIKKGSSAEDGKVFDPDTIVKMQIAADAIKAGDKGH
ncbi:MAG TPA: peptidylprolyl isomerase [Stellaceae bacterium]|nr:peptidylprolyl isomerase [Stellaceae bacterium]